MRNIPYAFLNEETIDQINRAERDYVDAFANLAATQQSMRGLMTWPKATASSTIMAAVKTTAKRFVAMLEKMMEMSGPNSIANLERALRSQEVRRQTE